MRGRGGGTTAAVAGSGSNEAAVGESSFIAWPQYMGPRRPSCRGLDAREAARLVRSHGTRPAREVGCVCVSLWGLEGWRHLEGDEERGAPQTRHLIGRRVCPMSGEIEDAAAAAWAIPTRSGRRSPRAALWVAVAAGRCTAIHTVDLTRSGRRALRSVEKRRCCDSSGKKFQRVDVSRRNL